MKKKSKKVEKLCSFYVSNWHLVTMLLPYINKQIDKNIKIITILENSIEENIKILLERLNLKNEKEILKINWKNFNSKKYEEVLEYLNQEKENAEKILILVSGNKENIENNNANIQKWLKKVNVKNVKIINLYEVTEFNNKILEILDQHDKVFNTSGEREISEVFEGYQKEKELKVVGNENTND